MTWEPKPGTWTFEVPSTSMAKGCAWQRCKKHGLAVGIPHHAWSACHDHIKGIWRYRTISDKEIERRERAIAKRDRPFQRQGTRELMNDCLDRVERHAPKKEMYALVRHLVREISALREEARARELFSELTGT